MQIIIDIPGEVYNRCKEYGDLQCDVGIAVKSGTPFPKEHRRAFEGIVVEYPPADLCTYPEYRGKPYFSIKYEENGEHFIGFGTYDTDVLSGYLQEYFIIPAIIETDKEEQI